MDLYGLPPEEFTAARDAAAKQDASLRGLRRPTVAAWVVNTLVRRDPALLGTLLELGASLADAQRQRRGDDLRELGEQRRQLLQAVTARAVELAGRDVSQAVRAEVESTLDAALADRASGEAVRTGQLVRALAFAGFGGVDLEGAVAPLPRPPVPQEAPQDTARIAGLEVAALEAAGTLDDAVQAAERAQREADAADRQLAEAEQQQTAAARRVSEAEQALETASRETAAAKDRRTGAAKAAKAATRAVAAAQQDADAARQALHRERSG
jgi:hypothetical protein